MSYSPSLPFWELYVACALAGCSTNTLEPDSPTGPPPARAQGSAAGDTLTAVADAHLRSAAKNLNSGTSQTIPVKITVGEGDTTRAIIKFDQAAIVAALGSRTLTGASLELPVKESGTDPAGNDIDVHRVLKPWTEAGVTWKCGEDLNTTNVGADCPTTKWKMNGADMDAFVATRTARVHLNPGQTGVATFDVTSDVQAFLAGGSNHGWLVNAASATSRALLWSREAALKPSLVLSVTMTESDTTRPVLPTATNWPVENPLLVTVPYNPSLKNFRDVLGIQFYDSTSGTTIRAFLAHFNAEIIGGFGHGSSAPFYVVRVPDPGATFEAVESLEAAMGAYGGVKRVMAMNYEGSFRLKGRYPVDSAIASNRSSWFGGGNPGNRPWLAVRAPLAWGCETGTYGGPRVKVGVLDAYFDVLHRDLSTSSVATFHPVQTEMVLDAAYATPQVASHGTGVLGIIAAQGDNGRDMAGMVWQGDLSLYAFGQGQYRTINPVAYFEVALASAAGRGVKVLNASFGVGDIQDTTVVAALRDYLLDYLDSGEDRLLVLAVGDSAVNISVTDLQTSTDTRLSALDRAAAQLYNDPAYRGKILFVTGANSAGQWRAGSNSFSGGDQIAAPAENVISLAGSSGMAAGNGTSFAAPFVAGSAAQLWAMDPSLTAAQVKDYILRGAQEPRVDPTTGISAPPANIGIPGVYQLDAYGALTLLSRERQGTPICGFPVTLELPQSGPRVRLARNGSNAETIAVNRISGYQVDGLSVAQGGRLFAVGQVNFEPNTPPTPMEVNEYALANGQWSVRQTIPDIAVRTYLEKDTVDSDNFSGFFGTRWTLRGPRWGSGTTLRLAETTQPYLTPITTPFYPFTYPYTYGVEFSPDGAFAVVRTRLDSPPCPNYQDQMWLVTLPNGPVQALLPTQCDGEGPRDAAWDPSSSRFILADIGANGVTYQARKIVSGVAQADGPAVTIPDRFPIDYSLGAEGHSTDPTGTTATWLELVQNGCYLTNRTTRTFALVSEQFYPYSNPDWLGFCQVPVQMLRTKLRSVTLRH